LSKIQQKISKYLTLTFRIIEVGANELPDDDAFEFLAWLIRLSKKDSFLISSSFSLSTFSSTCLAVFNSTGEGEEATNLGESSRSGSLTSLISSSKSLSYSSKSFAYSSTDGAGSGVTILGSSLVFLLDFLDSSCLLDSRGSLDLLEDFELGAGIEDFDLVVLDLDLRVI
jgi:hypothetical protein